MATDCRSNQEKKQKIALDCLSARLSYAIRPVKYDIKIRPLFV